MCGDISDTRLLLQIIANSVPVQRKKLQFLRIDFQVVLEYSTFRNIFVKSHIMILPYKLLKFEIPRMLKNRKWLSCAFLKMMYLRRLCLLESKKLFFLSLWRQISFSFFLFSTREEIKEQRSVVLKQSS